LVIGSDHSALKKNKPTSVVASQPEMAFLREHQYRVETLMAQLFAELGLAIQMLFTGKW
jgi:trans-aconitate methyltransferase